MPHDPVVDPPQLDEALAPAPSRRDTDIYVETTDTDAEHMGDAIRAAGFKLAAALPESEQAHRLVRSLPLYELALQLPDWVSQATRGRTTLNQDPAHLLRQVCQELEGPVEHLERHASARSRGELDLEGLRFVEEVRFAARRLRRLTNDLLDLASIGEGGFEVARLRFQVRDCVDAGLADVHAAARRRSCRVHVEVGPEVPATLVGDPGRLRQVLGTLVGNAVSRSERDEIRLSLSAELDPDRAVLLHGIISRLEGVRDAGLRRRLRDSGPTIWRGDARTGLGLAISRQLVAQMGGKTWVEAGPGGGSVLHFTTRCELANTDYERTTGAATRMKRRVLLVAAEGESVAALQDRLRSLNVALSVTWRADEAARMLADGSTSFDAIVLVAALASRRGSALVETISRIHDRPPIVLVTREGHRGDATRCRRLGIAAYLPQPASRRDLDDALQEITAHHDPSLEPTRRRHGLITRHFLRETRRRQHVRVIGEAPDVVATLLDLGHRVVDGDSAGEAPPDVLIVDVTPAPALAAELVAKALAEADGAPRVLALVHDPATTRLSEHARLATLARQHDTMALQQALRRLRDTGDDRQEQRSDRADSGQSMWPAIVARAGGDEALAHSLLRAFVLHAPNWLAEIDRAVRREGDAAGHVAFRQLRTSLVALGLRGMAELCDRLTAAHHALQEDETRRLLAELSGQLDTAMRRMRTTLDQRRYPGQSRD